MITKALALSVSLILVGCGRSAPPELADQIAEAQMHGAEKVRIFKELEAEEVAFNAIVKQLESEGYKVETSKWPPRIERVYSYSNRKLVYERSKF